MYNYPRRRYSRCVARVISGVCDCVRVCVCVRVCPRLENGLSYQHQNWYENSSCGSRSARTSKVKVTLLSNALPAWVCMSMDC